MLNICTKFWGDQSWWGGCMVIGIGEEDGCRVEAHMSLCRWSVSLLLHHIDDMLSPHYTRARGLRAEGSLEAEHFWIGSTGKRTA